MFSHQQNNWNWNVALITGGAGGLGRALAEFFLKKGKKVIIAGRTEAKLRDTCSQVKGLEYLVLDVAKLDTIPQFVKNATEKYPDIDCLVANAGIQKPMEILDADPTHLLRDADLEIDTNIRGTLHLVHHLLPHLLSKPQAAVFTVSSGLAFVPLAHVPVYSATKAFIHSWTQSLRLQIGDKIRVVEIAPPLVESDLHRDHPDPDNNKKHKNPMTLTQEEFISGVEHDMNSGRDEVAPGFAKKLAEASRDAFAERFHQMNTKQ